MDVVIEPVALVADAGPFSTPRAAADYARSLGYTPRVQSA